MYVDYSTSCEDWTTKVVMCTGIKKHIPNSTHPNLNLLNQIPYLLEIHLTYDKTTINDDNNSIISKDTMTCM